MIGSALDNYIEMHPSPWRSEPGHEVAVTILPCYIIWQQANPISNCCLTYTYLDSNKKQTMITVY